MEFYKSVIEGEPVYRAIHRARAILSHRPRFAEFEAASPVFYLSNWNSILAKSLMIEVGRSPMRQPIPQPLSISVKS
jgi:hypothetical protein